jgi:hypothetical protein
MYMGTIQSRSFHWKSFQSLVVVRCHHKSLYPYFISETKLISTKYCSGGLRWMVTDLIWFVSTGCVLDVTLSSYQGFFTLYRKKTMYRKTGVRQHTYTCSYGECPIKCRYGILFFAVWWLSSVCFPSDMVFVAVNRIKRTEVYIWLICIFHWSTYFHSYVCDCRILLSLIEYDAIIVHELTPLL